MATDLDEPAMTQPGALRLAECTASRTDGMSQAVVRLARQGMTAAEFRWLGWFLPMHGPIIFDREERQLGELRESFLKVLKGRD